MSTKSPPSTVVVDQTTVLSLLTTIAILGIAYISSLHLLHSSTTTKLRILFIWHAFDALIHFALEGSFIYHCFFTYISIPISSDYPHPASLRSSEGHFLGYSDRLYGSIYGDSFTAKLWQEYAKADRRWAGADLTVVSLELLTVFGAGPIALYICELIRRQDAGGKIWFWVCILATAELYGGFMTFAPEWLTGSPNLDTSNFMYFWVYLIFFNTLWVWFPLWILLEAYQNINKAFAQKSDELKSKKIL